MFTESWGDSDMTSTSEREGEWHVTFTLRQNTGEYSLLLM